VYKNEDGSLLLFAFWLTAPNPLVNGAPATGIGGTLSAEYEQNNGGHLALSMTGLEEEGGGFYRVPVLRPITEVDRLDFYGMSSNSDIQVIPWMHNPILVERTAGSSAPSVTDGGQLVLATKAIITTYLTGQTLYWFPLSRSLASWTTYRQQATEASAPNLGKYYVTLDSDDVNLTDDPDATFVLFSGASQPASFTDGLQTASLLAEPSSSGVRTVLVTAPEGSTLYWYPLSRSLSDWETYRTLATEAAAPNAGRYSATLSAITADLTTDPYATFILFSGSSQPSSVNDGIRAVILGPTSTATSVATPTDVSYSIVQRRVGHYLFGIRSGFSEDQQNDINDCLHDGLRRVYTAHDWSFLHPVTDVSTTAPYVTGTVTVASGVVTLIGGTFPTWAADGIFQVNNRYYSVASRGSSTQLTLDTTSVTVATASSYKLARPEIPLDEAFDAVTNDSDLHYYPSPDCWYPPVKWRHDATIRQLEGNNPEFDRPMFYSVRTVRFDPTVGSRKVLALYPAPDQVYTLRVPMILRPVLLDEVNFYAIGGEVLSQVILEACLASAEHNFEEREHVHEKRYMELIGQAIRSDQERSCPTSLGPDAPRGEGGRFGMDDYAYRLREQRIGSVSIDGYIQ
jgi:hypothetical protein